jgi:RNA polymerase sigma factor (sigma-70 family)
LMWVCRSPQCDCEGHQRRSLERDESAAKELARTLTPLVDAIVRKKLRSAHREDREDVRHDTFLRVFKNLGQWRGDCPFCLWVRQIAIRAAFDQARRNLRLERIPKFEEDPDELVDPQPPPLGPRVWTCIERTVERLPEDQRRAYELHVKQDQTIAETARTLGTSERTIYTWLERIRKRLLDCLD